MNNPKTPTLAFTGKICGRNRRTRRIVHHLSAGAERLRLLDRGLLRYLQREEEILMELRTKRLLLREWKDEDIEPLARMNDDPRVVRYIAKLTDRSAIHAWINEQREHFKKHGYGLWARGVARSLIRSSRYVACRCGC